SGGLWSVFASKSYQVSTNAKITYCRCHMDVWSPLWLAMYRDMSCDRQRHGRVQDTAV
ncbi:hypothetical protein J1N35_038088, partial [Gossypium stocksii]